MRLLVILATLLATSVAEASYCRKGANGKPRIERTGTCPTGYFASGDCCEAFLLDAKEAFPRKEGKTCPTGFYASGGACVSFR